MKFELVKNISRRWSGDDVEIRQRGLSICWAGSSRRRQEIQREFVNHFYNIHWVSYQKEHFIVKKSSSSQKSWRYWARSFTREKYMKHDQNRSQYECSRHKNIFVLLNFLFFSISLMLRRSYFLNLKWRLLWWKKHDDRYPSLDDISVFIPESRVIFFFLNKLILKCMRTYLIVRKWDDALIYLYLVNFFSISDKIYFTDSKWVLDIQSSDKKTNVHHRNCHPRLIYNTSQSYDQFSTELIRDQVTFKSMIHTRNASSMKDLHTEWWRYLISTISISRFEMYLSMQCTTCMKDRRHVEKHHFWHETSLVHPDVALSDWCLYSHSENHWTSKITLHEICQFMSDRGHDKKFVMLRPSGLKSRNPSEHGACICITKNDGPIAAAWSSVHASCQKRNLEGRCSLIDTLWSRRTS